MKVSMYVAASIDGFIARKDNSIDWLSEIDGVTDFGYKEFYGSVDVLCMGNHTYQQISAAHEWPYADKTTWVFSKAEFTPAQKSVQVTSINPEHLVVKLHQKGNRHLWVLGGGEIHSLFLNAGLVDEMRIFVMPIALGEGIPLFSPPVTERRWKLSSAKAWPGDVGELWYVRG